MHAGAHCEMLRTSFPELRPYDTMEQPTLAVQSAGWGVQHAASVASGGGSGAGGMVDRGLGGYGRLEVSAVTNTCGHVATSSHMGAQPGSPAQVDAHSQHQMARQVGGWWLPHGQYDAQQAQAKQLQQVQLQ